MSTSKETLSARLQRKTISLSEKKNCSVTRKTIVRSVVEIITEIFNIGKTSAATIIKNVEKLRKDYASFEGNWKRIRQGQFHKLNEAMYLWYK